MYRQITLFIVTAESDKYSLLWWCVNFHRCHVHDRRNEKKKKSCLYKLNTWWNKTNYLQIEDKYIQTVITVNNPPVEYCQWWGQTSLPQQHGEDPSHSRGDKNKKGGGSGGRGQSLITEHPVLHTRGGVADAVDWRNNHTLREWQKTSMTLEVSKSPWPIRTSVVKRYLLPRTDVLKCKDGAFHPLWLFSFCCSCCWVHMVIISKSPWGVVLSGSINTWNVTTWFWLQTVTG